MIDRSERVRICRKLVPNLPEFLAMKQYKKGLFSLITDRGVRVKQGGNDV